MGIARAVSHDRHHNLRLVSSSSVNIGTLSPETQSVFDKLCKRAITTDQLKASYWLLKELDAEGVDQDSLFKATREIERRRGFIVEG